jgi:C4-dicarboxylate-specific signal transduction histidine kinase
MNALLHKRAIEKNIKLESSVEPDMTVTADKIMTEQVLISLVKNIR